MSDTSKVDPELVWESFESLKAAVAFAESEAICGQLQAAAAFERVESAAELANQRLNDLTLLLEGDPENAQLAQDIEDALYIEVSGLLPTYAEQVSVDIQLAVSALDKAFPGMQSRVSRRGEPDEYEDEDEDE